MVAEPKKKSKVGQFFLSLLKCAGYYAVFYGIVALFQTLYMIVIAGSLPGGGVDANGYQGMSDAYWNAFSSDICWLMTASYAVILLTFNLIFICRKKKPLAEVGICKTQLASAPASFVFGVALQIAVVFVIGILSSVIPGIAEDSASNQEVFDHMYGNASLLSQFIFMAVATPIMEEVIFRGLIYTRMKKGMPQAAAMLLSALAFGFAHSGFVQITYATALGIIMVLMYEKYESLWPCIFLHAGFNATNFLYDCLNMNSILVQYWLLFTAAGLVLAFIAYFFVTKPVYNEDIRRDENEII
jgi:membrane protease YdiL (CAAX protease family)